MFYIFYSTVAFQKRFERSWILIKVEWFVRLQSSLLAVRIEVVEVVAMFCLGVEAPHPVV